MIRFFIWQCGTIAFVAVIWRYGYWREILPLAVLGSAFLWIVCGGILLSRGGRKGARLAHDSPVDAGGMDEAKVRAAAEVLNARRAHARSLEEASLGLDREPRFPGSEK